MTKTAYVRRSIPRDIPVVAANMRQADRDEVAVGDNGTPEKALLSGLLMSKPCMTICGPEDEPVGMYGAVPHGDRVGAVWLLGTDDLVQRKDIRLRFLREVKAHVASLFDHYDLLFNTVDARNEVHVKWIRWVGFTFIAEHPNYGAEGRLFLEFCKVRS